MDYQNKLFKGCFTDKALIEEKIERARVKGIDETELYAMSTPQKIMDIAVRIMKHQFEFFPIHEGQVPKDDGTMRTVYIGEDEDRIVYSIANDKLFELCPDMIHKSCKSYQKGLGTGKTILEVAEQVYSGGYKGDLSKFFDSVPLPYIDGTFSKVENHIGKDLLLDCIVNAYHDNRLYTLDGEWTEKFTSLRQGCAIAAFLADSILYDIDKELSEMEGVYYVRYSDDFLILGPNHEKGMEVMSKRLADMGLTLNPKKIEKLSSDRYFTFLGFSIKGRDISISKKGLKTFTDEIYKRTNWHKTYEQACREVKDYLYYGNGQYCWATSKLTIMNNKRDLTIMSLWVQDRLRGVKCHHTKPNDIGGLGYNLNCKLGVVDRGKGTKVSSNYLKTREERLKFMSIRCAQDNLLTSREVFDAIVRTM